jgi:hypothetical protein
MREQMRAIICGALVGYRSFAKMTTGHPGAVAFFIRGGRLGSYPEVT